MDTNPNALKLMFNETVIRKLGADIQAVYAAFPKEAFIAQALADLDKREFKERIAWIASALHKTLPPDFPQAIHILMACLPSAGDEFFEGGPAMWIIEHFVEKYGLDHLDASLAAMYEITKRHTAEFAIRPFLVRYPDQTLSVLQKWAHDSDARVRRLVSEGTRPRLPWGMRLNAFIKDPAPTMQLLEHLKNDPSETVRRSVANHLNDIGKDHPQILVALAIDWSKQASSETWEIIRHALRSRVKAGDTDALRLLGYDGGDVALSDFSVAPLTLQLNDTLTMRFSLQNNGATAQNLMVDYVVHHVKANGGRTPKVFKLTARLLQAGEAFHIEKRHTIRPITTRRYYSGVHRIEIQVNGRILGGADFTLVV